MDRNQPCLTGWPLLPLRQCRSRLARGCLVVGLLAVAPAAQATIKPGELTRQAVSLACKATTQSAVVAMGRKLSGHLDKRHLRMSVMGWRHSFVVGDGRLTVERLAPRGGLRRVTVQYEETRALRPVLLAMADGDCTIRTARRIRYDRAGRPIWLEDLDRELRVAQRRLPLNPPIPAERDPGGVPVALIDTGVNYLLPQIARRLARDAEDQPLGYDYWDMDTRPFDAHPVRSAFFPGRHGTQTATLLLHEAPVVKLVPYRYPRPRMQRMAELVEDLAGHGIRLVNISLVSDDRAEWQAFSEAARRHPEILFIVAAANDGRDIDRAGAYPATFPLDNIITVTAVGRDGRLAADANWGARSVDVAAPAEELSVIDAVGQRRRVSGSSYAAVRVTALAACLLHARPGLRAQELRQAIFDHADDTLSPAQLARGVLTDAVLSGPDGCRRGPLASGI